DEPPPKGWVSHDGRILTDTARRRLDALRETVESIRARAYLPLAELVLFTAHSWNLDIEVRATRKGGAVGGDEAIHAFAEAARGFSAGADHATLGAFLSWLKASSEHEDGLDAPVEEPRRGAVQVQTIHAAKGMEWEVVAVPGLVDGTFPKVDVSGNADSPTYRSSAWLVGAGVLPWPLRRDRDQLPSWEWERAGDLKEFEVLQREFREAAGRHAITEERRSFYVAMTRARTDVILTGSPRVGGRPPRPASIFLRDLAAQDVIALESRFAAGGDGETESESRRVVWPQAPTPAQEGRRRLAAEVLAAVAKGASTIEQELPYAREIEALLVEAEGEKPSEVAVAAPIHLSSTDLVRLSRDRDAFALARRRPLPTEPSRVALQGDAFHAWVERYFRTPTLIDPDEPLDDEEVEESLADRPDLEALRSRFLESEWSRRLPEAVEVDVEVPLQGLVLRCRIDAVFPPGAGLDRVTVIDWKTGHAPRDPKERASREVQLAVYRLAWAAWRGVPIEEVDAAFVYIATGETTRPKRLLGEEEILALINGG
ncbi:MAG: PD-(D/E)XK nuclease family protein, partial [Demequinaceae bacterium]|nr:PD-(D/E)XK nuclease family protein [Demequinaceae bacterium]